MTPPRTSSEARPGAPTADAMPQPAAARPPALLPGLALSVAVAVMCMTVNHFASMASPLLLAIIVGAVLANVRTLPAAVQPGLAFSGKRLLRAGIVLLGLQLSLQDIAGLGLGMIVVVVGVVSIGIVVTVWIGGRLGLTWTQRLLIACGFSICGAAAVAAADGVIDADEDEVATGVALVVIFGTLMIAVIPLLSTAFGLGSHTAGLWAGTSVHEVAQVVATAGAIGGGALSVAVIAKLARVLMLAPVMAVIGYRRRREIARTGGDGQVKMPPFVPLFIVGFVAMVVLGSVTHLPSGVTDPLKQAQTGLLAAAMFALGTGVRRSAMKAVGPRPFVLALLSTIVVSTISLGGVLLLG